MKDKGKGVEGSSEVVERSIILVPIIEKSTPLSFVPSIFTEDVSLEDLMIGNEDEDEDEVDDDEEEEEDDKQKSGDDEKYRCEVSEASTENNIDDLMNDSVNEESGGADGKGESSDAQNVQQAEKLILRLDTYREEGEHFHTYTLETIREMMNMVNPDFKFDFEEELNAFDINQQPEYEYKYVEDADMYDRVELEDWTDDESFSEDTSQLPTLMEFLKS
ncbi:hypothetical protein Hanom_Chr08g00734451 [Helianthus anomalus]